MRDVVSIGTGTSIDQVTIRFFTDNPGPWFLHCHIDWHLNAYAFFMFSFFPLLTVPCSSGLAVVFAEDVPDVSTQDIHTGAYTLFVRIQQLYDSLQPSGMTFAPNTTRLSTRLERHNHTHSILYRTFSIPGHSFTGSRTIRTIYSRLIYRVVLIRVLLMYGLVLYRSNQK